MKDTTCPKNTHTALIDSDECIYCGYKPKIKDTTTTIDTIANIFADYDIGNINVFEAMDRVEAWHKDKARSYVPEKKPTHDTILGKLPEDQAYVDGKITGHNNCIDQTLKAIGGEDNE